MKCRSAVIYLSRIDASPEVNGRVVTISRRTGQVRAVEDSANGGERGSTLISAPCEASTPRPNTMFPVPHPTDIPSHEPLNYFSIEGGGGTTDRDTACLTRLIFSFLMPLRFINGGNDLWAARFVLGSPSNQGDNHDPSCRCSSFFFFLLRKILFECFSSRVGAPRMKLGDDGLVKGGQTRSELFSRTKDRKIYSSLSTVLIPISPFFSINPYGKVCAVPGVQTYIFFFTRKSGNLSQMYRECTRRGSVFGKGSRAIFHSERSAAIPARGSLSETGV